MATGRYEQALEAIDLVINEYTAALKEIGETDSVEILPKQLHQALLQCDIIRGALLMLVGRLDEAKDLFLKDPHATIITKDYEMPKSAFVVHYLGFLREVGMHDPLMDQITGIIIADSLADQPRRLIL
jgi:hypothetical protein